IERRSNHVWRNFRNGKDPPGPGGSRAGFSAQLYNPPATGEPPSRLNPSARTIIRIARMVDPSFRGAARTFLVPERLSPGDAGSRKGEQMGQASCHEKIRGSLFVGPEVALLVKHCFLLAIVPRITQKACSAAHGLGTAPRTPEGLTKEN